MQVLSLEEARKRSQEQQNVRYDDQKNQQYEFVARGDVITMYDPKNVKNGVYQDMTHFVRNAKGELEQISTEEANKRVGRAKPQKLESKYYGGGLMAVKGLDGKPIGLDLSSKKKEGKVKVLPLEEARKRSQEQQNVRYDDQKNQRYEFVARGDVITMYDPKNVKNGVYQDMTHFVRNAKGELEQISTEEANKRVGRAKPQKLESKYYGGGLMAVKGLDGKPIGLDLSSKEKGQDRTHDNVKLNQAVLAARAAAQGR